NPPRGVGAEGRRVRRRRGGRKPARKGGPLRMATVPLVQALPVAARALLLAALAVGIEWARALAVRGGADPTLALALGGGALVLLAAGRPLRDLGLTRERLGLKLLGGLALAVVLLLPAAVRWTEAP